MDVSNFDTNSVTNMSYMFYKCAGLEELDLSNFDTSSVTDKQVS
nr:BspA family leucine-rich repeat surface protein [Listeria monocytogenes]